MGIHGEREKIDGTIGVYVHIPFCASRCPYCDFASTACAPDEAGYVRCLERELRGVIERGEAASTSLLESIYIGGGTPSLFSPASVGRIIASVKAAFAPAPSCEVTIEANPESSDGERLAGYVEAGGNRLSLGIQSLDDGELRTLGRIHTARGAVSAFCAARKAGFENIGVDLIFGVPGGSERSFAASLSRAVELGPEHISVYGLTYEEGTTLTRAKEAGRLDGLPSEEQEERMYRYASRLLTGRGFVHYEVSNWALPGLESRHNSRYWLGGEYVGLGAGAHSYSPAPAWGKRTWNEASVEGYMGRIAEAGEARAGVEVLDRGQAMTESLMLGLRMLRRGLRTDEFRERFGLVPEEAFERCAALEEQGLIRSSGGGLFLTGRGVLLSDELFIEMI
ncbi:MAG: radical SAM family heme chaperone HemW [Thermodesulfobacteriota bacterium]